MTYTYDTRNRLSTVTDWTGKTTSLNYDKANRLEGNWGQVAILDRLVLFDQLRPPVFRFVG